MKFTGILSALFAVVSAVVAQTGTNAPAGRTMSLQDCIQAALAHNFDVQIERYNPQISLYNLNAAYSGYDPAFNISGQHNYNVHPALHRFDEPTRSHRPTKPVSNPTSAVRCRGDCNMISAAMFRSNTDGNALNPAPFDDSGGSIGVSLTQPLLKNFWIDTTRLNDSRRQKPA